MNHQIWAAIREYIAAEIKLNDARKPYGSNPLRPEEVHKQVADLEKQSTRMETEIRRLIDRQPATTQLSDAQQAP